MFHRKKQRKYQNNKENQNKNKKIKKNSPTPNNKK
jgi:hypothetical protein